MIDDTLKRLKDQQAQLSSLGEQVLSYVGEAPPAALSKMSESCMRAIDESSLEPGEKFLAKALMSLGMTMVIEAKTRQIEMEADRLKEGKDDEG